MGVGGACVCVCVCEWRIWAGGGGGGIIKYSIQTPSKPARHHSIIMEMAGRIGHRPRAALKMWVQKFDDEAGDGDAQEDQRHGPQEGMGGWGGGVGGGGGREGVEGRGLRLLCLCQSV